MRYLFDSYVMDADRRELRCGEAAVDVEPQVFDLLLFLIQNRDRVVSRDDLLASVWRGRIVSESTLDTRISAARAAVGDSGERQRLIKTLPRKGIRFVGAVRESPTAPTPVPPPAAMNTANLPADRPSIAVLPFTNMSGDPEQEYFADGMAEEIITALSRCRWLAVIARNSSFTYKGRTVDVRQVGRDLGVRYVLEGSVRRGGNRLRITGQLNDATLGTSIWGDRFEGDRREVFELQDRITESVVAAIEPKLQLAEIERLKRKPDANLDAYDLLLRAQQLEYEFTAESLSKAIGLIEQAVRMDPDYAPAMALGAYCHAVRWFQGWTRAPDVEGAEGLRLAMRASELGRDDANVLWMAGYALRELGMDVRGSQELVNRSLQLNPSSAIALTISAWNEIILENPGKALDLLARAERLSPRDPRGWFMFTAAALAYLTQGELEQSVASARKALVQNPRSRQALTMLASSLAQLGDRAGAQKAMKGVLDIEPELTISRLRARLKFMPESIWSRFSSGLRSAGFPE